MEYMVGCNYWGSKYGIDMWKNWDEDSVSKDLEELSKYNIKYLRVFPNWREFQPIYALRGWRNKLCEYRFADERPIDNEFGIDMEAIEKFRKFCEIAENNGIKLVDKPTSVFYFARGEIRGYRVRNSKKGRNSTGGACYDHLC